MTKYILVKGPILKQSKGDKPYGNKLKDLYNAMVETLNSCVEEEYVGTDINTDDSDNAIEQAIWWYCNDRCDSTGPALRDIKELLSPYKPSDGESGVNTWLSCELYEELSSMAELH